MLSIHTPSPPLRQQTKAELVRAMLRSGVIHAAASLRDDTALNLGPVALQVAQELLYSAEDVDDEDAARAEACLGLCDEEKDEQGGSKGCMSHVL